MTSLDGGVSLTVMNNPVLTSNVFGSKSGIRIRSNSWNLALNNASLGTISQSTMFIVMDMTLTQDISPTQGKFIFSGVEGGRNYLRLNPNNTLETWFNTPGYTTSSPIPSRKGVFCARWNGQQYSVFHMEHNIST